MQKAENCEGLTDFLELHDFEEKKNNKQSEVFKILQNFSIK